MNYTSDFYGSPISSWECVACDIEQYVDNCCERGICVECNKLIPDHIPKEQYRKYVKTHMIKNN